MPEGKYLIHARVRTDGVVERNDVVGAIFGQTEGLLGEDLELRTLQQSAKVGRIDVALSSEDGQSTGEITIATGLDRVETAVLAAALETIDQVGPCRADVEVTELEDLREAKRRAIVERAEELLAGFEAEALTSEELVEAVRRRARVQEVTTFEGLPAGPRVEDSDAIIVVEGRADVLQLLEYGIKNAIAVEGTDVPEAVARLSRDRTVTAFFDGDRGGELIHRELAQVADVDYVAFAPDGRSVEDLTRAQILEALRRKVPVDHLDDDLASTSTDDSGTTFDADGRPDAASGSDATSRSETKGSGDPTSDTGERGQPIPDGARADPSPAGGRRPTESGDGATSTPGAGPDVEAPEGPREESVEEGTASDGPDSAAPGGTEADDGDGSDSSDERTAEPATLPAHVDAVVRAGTGTARLLDAEFETVAEAPTDEARDLVAEGSPEATTLVLDGRLTQATLDVAAQRGLGQIVTREEGDFVKQPTAVRIRTADEL